MPQKRQQAKAHPMKETRSTGAHASSKKTREVELSPGTLTNPTLTNPDDFYPKWLINRKDFQAIFPRFSTDENSDENRIRTAALKSSDNRNADDIQNISKWVTKVPTMKNLNPSQASEIAKICKYMCVSAGEFIFRQGDPGDACYLCFTGSVDIISNDERVGTLTQGSCFGEVALEIQGRGRSAGIQAATNCELLQIRVEDYKRTLFRYHLNRKKAMIKWLKREVNLLHDFSEHKLKYFETVSVDVTIAAGEVIYAEGDEVGAMYFVKSGEVRIEKNVLYERHHRRPSSRDSWVTQVHRNVHKVQIATEKASDYFGFETFLNLSGRIHSAIALTDVQLIAINKIDCNSFLFQGRVVERMAKKYHSLASSRQNSMSLADTRTQPIIPPTAVLRSDTPPLRMLQKFPYDTNSPDYQFPCLVRSKEMAPNAIVRRVQMSAFALNGSIPRPLTTGGILTHERTRTNSAYM